MLVSNKLDKIGLRMCKKGLRESRETELCALKNADKVSNKLLSDIISGEKSYRDFLNREIEKIKRGQI